MADGTDEDLAEPAGETLEVALAAADAGQRLDKALAQRAPDLSRARLQALIEAGAVRLDGRPVASGSAKARPGLYRIEIPAPVADVPEPENIPLIVLHEDADLIVLDKPAGMAVHPGPGSERGTLVAALLHHCAGQLSGIGGVARPGIVHRLDKDTSGVMVAAKTDRAHQGLSTLFSRHDLERSYIALTRSAPEPRKGRIETRIGRSPHDRKKMAVLKSGGREAVTDYAVERVFGPEGGGGGRPLAARVRCRLHTGRTHQIRVHLASLGAPCLGDPVYGSGAPARPVRDAIESAQLHRQALHAAVLGFVHPVTGETMRFETLPPEDMLRLEEALAQL
ncbi:MAG: RluA family pseudouridine synthase [Caulobacteraceae bacterium]|nr:RluA family pseudouridine synthase [Caulobacteraceae bacterium]